MAFILASMLNTHIRDELGNRVSIALDNENGILDNIKRFVPRADKLVIVANNPTDHDDNDVKLEAVRESFDKTGINFTRAFALDDRNKRAAKEIVDGADLIILSGGKCLCQNKFFGEIGLKKLLENHKGLTIGVSAGAMNLCKTVANFPEEEIDLSEPRRFAGMGFFDGVVIPHFDGEEQRYQFDCGELDIVNDFILPMSRDSDFIALPNGSYILIDNDGAIEYYGDVYKISGGHVTKFLYGKD